MSNWDYGLFLLILDVELCDDLLGILGKVALHHPVIVAEVEFSEYLFDGFALVFTEVEYGLFQLIVDDTSREIDVAVMVEYCDRKSTSFIKGSASLA